MVGITATDSRAIEGVDNALVFTVGQNNVSNFDTTVVVTLDTSTLSATDIDTISYTNASGTLITLSTLTDIQNFLTNGDSVRIPAGNKNAPAITVTVIDDNIYEQSENIVLTISNASNATVGSNASATGTVLDEDNGNPNDGSTTDGDKPVVSITGTEKLSETAANGTANTATYTISLSNPSALDTSVVVSIAAGSATGNGTDYIAPVTQVVTIPAGQTSVNITVPLVDDTNFEGPENFNVSISSIAPVSTGNVTIDPVNNTVNTTIYDDGTTDGTTPGGVNDNIVPVAVADTLTLTEDVSVGSNSGNVLTNDNLGNTPTQSFTWGTEFARYGSITKNPDGTYNYALSNSNTDVQELAIGETLTETFTYSYRDQDGETANSTLTITITGTNDQPKITNGASLNGVIDSRQITEQTDTSVITQTGTINFTDVDTSNELTLSYLINQNIFTFGSNNTALKSLTADQQAALENIFSVNQPSTSNNEASWNINASYTALDFIPSGETLTIRYAVQVNDNEGITTAANGNQLSTSAIRYIQVTITGTNDGIALVNDSKTMLEDRTLTGNIFTNDKDDPDIGEMLTIESYSVNGTVVLVTTGTNTATAVTIDGNTVGQITMNSDGSYVFTPTANYSGTVPTITANVSNGLPVGNPNRSSGSETLDITVTPVSDAPTLSAVSVKTNEDTAVVLGLKAPIIKDANDLTANTDDSPERIGLITLTGIPRDVTLDYGSGNITTTTANQTIKILLSDGHTVNNPPGQNSSTITMTRAEFEAMTLTPPRDSATNISFGMSVTEYEVDNTGTVLSGVAGATSNTTIKVNVQAVTDSSNTNQSGDDFSTFGYAVVPGVSGNTYTVSAKEGDSVALPITTAFGDLVGDGDNCETYGFVIRGLQPDAVILFTPAGDNTVTEYTANPSGEVLIGVNAASPTSTTLAVSSGSEPKISIKSAIYNSLDMKDITVSLYTQDHDSDSDLNPNISGNQRDATVELISTVTVDMTVTPVAGQVELDNTGVQTEEDTAVTLDKFGFTVLDTQDGAGAETITEISFVLPESWTYNDGGSPVVGAVGGTTITISGITANDNLDLDAYLQDFSITPPAQSSTDADFTFTVTTSDPDDNTGTAITGTAELTQKVTVTPVAETVGADVTINPSHDYGAITASEDTAFALNQGGFDLSGGWSNQDDTVNFGEESHTTAFNDSEQTYAHLTFGNKDGSTFTAIKGAIFTYNDGTGNISLTDSGSGVDIPAAYLNTVTVTPPQDYSDFDLDAGSSTVVKVQAKTIDYDEDTGSSVTATSGESYLTFIVKGVADPVTLGVDPAYGNEDQAIEGQNERDGTVMPAIVNSTAGIPLIIRPSSRDNDGSEVYNVTIADIPVGAKLYVDNGVDPITPLTISGGSVTISDYTNAVDNLYFVPAENYSGTVNLKVSAVSVENNIEGTASSVLNLPITVVGQADLILNDKLKTVDVDGKAYTYTIAENDLDDDSNLIPLAEFFADASAIEAYDGDTPTAEQVTYKVTGVPIGFDITGAVFLGGSGESRSWSVSLEALQDGSAQLVTPEHFAGEVDFTITGTTTETVSGNSATHDTQAVSLVVTPDAADGVVKNPQVLAVEDTWTTVNFVAAFSSGDTTAPANIATGYEALETIKLTSNDLIGQNVALRVDGVEVPLVADQTYTYNANQTIEIMYNDSNRHSDDDVTIPFDYTYTDTASLTDNSTISRKSQTGSANIDVTFQAVTDAPRIELDVTDDTIVISNANDNNSASVIVSLSSDDQDGSESFTRLEVTDVPAGVIVEGGILSGGTWYVDVPDTAIAITNIAPTYTLVLTRDPNTANIPEGKFTVTVTGITQDINGEGLSGNEAFVAKTFVLDLDRAGTGENPIDPNLIATLETIPPLSQTEDGAVKLSDVINATLKTATASTVTSYSFKLTDLPDDTVLTSSNSGVQVQKIGGQWLVSVDNANGLTPNAALAAVTLTPPADFSTNDTSDPDQNLNFGVEFTALNNQGLKTSTDIDVSVEIKPVTDPINNDTQTSRLATNEDTTVAVNINLTNSADGDYVSIIDGKLYLQLDESGLTKNHGTTGVLTDRNGTPLTPVSLVDSQVGNIPAGTYYVVDVADTDPTIDGINPADSITVNYTPAANEDGKAVVKVYTTHTEVSNISGHNSGTLTYEHSYNIAVAAQPDKLSIAYDDVVAKATGNEDTKIAIDYKINVVDENDTAAAITFDEVPNGYLVYYTNKSGVVVLASNNGDSDGNGKNLWSIDASKLENVNSGAAGEANNIFIAPPENVSGVITGIEMTVINNSGMASDSLVIDLDVTPVADDVVFNPSTLLGSQGKWAPLNLNAAMVDVDGSETVSIIVSGTNLYGDALELMTNDGTALDVEWTAPSGTKPGFYVISGVPVESLNSLFVKSATSYIGPLEITLQTVETANSATFTTPAGTIEIDVRPTLVFDGTDNDDELISVNQTAALKYSGGAGDDTFIGGSGNDTFNGDAGNDTLIGNAGNDIINGGAGNDTIDGGTGNDTIVFDADDLVINGGDGSDTLLINVSGTTIDFGTFDSSKFESIEVIDMTGNGAQSLTNLSTSDVLDIINDTLMTNKGLIINGNSADSVSLTATGWTNSGITTQDGINYNVYSFSDANGNHDLLIQTGINFTII